MYGTRMGSIIMHKNSSVVCGVAGNPILVFTFINLSDNTVYIEKKKQW